MAFTPTQQLQSDQHIYLRDQQHAARLFTDDQFRLAPKSKFLFHVAFGINQAALKTIDLIQRHKNEIGMLVKNIDLPKYTVSTETLNQYNRKKIVQVQQKGGIDFKITFHDDNMGVINQLWQNYYSYYYADSSSANSNGAYDRNATKSFGYINNSYGLDNGSTLPFFNYITIYQMARHEYVSYKLINPVIKDFNHNKVDYTDTKTHEFSMGLEAEAVAYGLGSVTSGNVEGFAMEHYDLTPSPLTTVDPTSTSSSPTFTTSASVANNAPSFLGNLITTVNTYQNTQQLNNANLTGIISNIGASAQQGVSGLQGIAFPQSNVPTQTTTASQVNLGK